MQPWINKWTERQKDFLLQLHFSQKQLTKWLMDGEKKPTPSDEPFVYTLAMQVVCQSYIWNVCVLGKFFI